jgi:hypothetical protein
VTAPEHCQACGHPGHDDDPIVQVASVDPVLTPNGSRIHQSHTTDPQSGFYWAEVAS